MLLRSAPAGPFMPSILDDLLAALPAQAVPVRQVLVGSHWAVVCSRGTGMAAALMSDHPHGHSHVRAAGRLHDQSAQALAELARSDDLLEASIGVAAINSLLEPDASLAQELNAADVLSVRGKGKTVALVGHFPFIERLRPQVGQLWVIERHPLEGEYPAEAAVDLLPQADVIAITGSALINHTLDGLLALCGRAATVMVLGPSTPLSPVLFRHGAGILSGARVVDESAVLRTASQGASFRQVEGVKLLTLVRGDIT
jgi:uncharacterized protein (DUF4213/DUF364 family)